jgi:pimeloyl-ACP methyl ester carboxylesterase
VCFKREMSSCQSKKGCLLCCVCEKKAKFRDKRSDKCYCSRKCKHQELCCEKISEDLEDVELPATPMEELSGRYYKALSQEPNPLVGHQPRPELYKDPGEPEVGRWKFDSPTGNEYLMEDQEMASEFWIEYTRMGHTLHKEHIPTVLFLHGVPTNRRQWYDVQRRVASFFPTISIDMLGMGESAKPLDYELWDWASDADYIRNMMNELLGGEKFVFVADDWGGGILATYAGKYPETLLCHILQDPISLDGYPVKEIEAIGRASGLPYDPKTRNDPTKNPYAAAMGAFDQTLWQIYKTMVYNADKVYNQRSLRPISFPYMALDYARPGPLDLETLKKEASRTGDYSEVRDAPTKDEFGFTPVNPKSALKMHAIRVLSQRASLLSSSLLLPFDKKENPKGVNYLKTETPVLILWGDYDNMMPPEQAYRFAIVYAEAKVDLHTIKDAGHFAATDQPKVVTETILNFLRRELGWKRMGDVYLGHGSNRIWKGDEEHVIKAVRDILGK